MLFFFNSLDGQKLLGEFRLTRIALNTQAEIPSATSYSPRSFGRIKLFSIEEVNILQHRKLFIWFQSISKLTYKLHITTSN